jgi:hypothetical protein
MVNLWKTNLIKTKKNEGVESSNVWYDYSELKKSEQMCKRLKAEFDRDS